MKKIVKLSLIVLIITAIIYSFHGIYAESSCRVTLQLDKSEYKKGDTITAYVKLSNVQPEMKIITLGLTLDYDKDSLELLEMTGENHWETPVDGATYNNGIIVIARGGIANSDETAITIKFLVKENSAETVKIGLKSISLGGANLIKPEDFYINNIAIVENTSSNPTPSNPTSSNPTPSNPTPSNPTPDNPEQDIPEQDNPEQDNPEQDNNEQDNTEQDNPSINDVRPNNSTSNNKTNTMDSNTSSGTLPKTGEKTSIMIVIAILVFMICSIIFYIKDKKITNKKATNKKYKIK